MSATISSRTTNLANAHSRTVAVLALVLTSAALSGCGGEAHARLDNYLDELELDTALESVEEIKLGSYYISAAVSAHDKAGREAPPVWVRIRFDLYAVIAPQDRKSVLAALDRHRGMLDDAVLTVCRDTSIDDLKDSRWATLRADLIDSVRPLLGDQRIKQVMFGDEFTWEPL